MPEIKCANCDIEFHRKPYHIKRFKGPLCCSRRCRGEYLKAHYTGANNPNHKHSFLENCFIARINSIKHRSKKLDVPFNLSLEHLINLYNQQQGLCYYTGIPMQLITTDFKNKGQASLDVMSVDRQVPKLGYVDDNVVLCCNGVNKFKGNESTEDFMDFLKFFILQKSDTCEIKVKLLTNTARLPARNKIGDVGYDLYTDKITDVEDGLVKVHFGISVQPPIGWCLEMFPRSSIYKFGVLLVNSVGLIDNGYRGEICGVFQKIKGYVPLSLGQRLVQIVPRKYSMVKMVSTDTLDNSIRGVLGFGSSGK
jgi:dUTP pyrophosphatase